MDITITKGNRSKRAREQDADAVDTLLRSIGIDESTLRRAKAEVGVSGTATIRVTRELDQTDYATITLETSFFEESK